MNKINNLRLKVLPAVLAAAMGINSCSEGFKQNLDIFFSKPRNDNNLRQIACYKTSRYNAEYLQVNDDFAMKFTSDIVDKDDNRFYMFSKNGCTVLNVDGDALPFYIYYSGPTPSQLPPVNNKDSLEKFVNNTLRIKSVILSKQGSGWDTTLETRTKYKPILSKAIVDCKLISDKYGEYKQLTEDYVVAK